MQFNKYKELGAYHWKEYGEQPIYTNHVDFVVGWIKEKKILDVGAGDGLITYKLKAKGIDNEPLAVKYAKEKGANVIRGNAYKLYGKYDAVYIGDTLEHLEYPEKALKQAKKVAPILYIAVPQIIPGIIDKYHYQEWTPQQLNDLVEGVGYELKKMFMGNGRIYAKFKV